MGISDGARITVVGRHGKELFSQTPPQHDVSVPINDDQYPVRICVYKEGYAPFKLFGLQDGSLVQEAT